MKTYTVILFICFSQVSFAQTDTSKWLHNFILPADNFNKDRLTMVLATEATLYTAATVGLYQLWYKNYPSTQFHFFNDNGEWLQYDKIGHVYTAYFETNITTGWYQWTGMKDEKAYWAGAVTGSILQLTIEAFDAYSEKWGFSVGDLAANTLGAGLSMSQYYLWDEQRIRIKFSSHFVNYPDDAEIEQRTDQLYGISGVEKILKDYNGGTYWLSVNPGLFMQNDTQFPKWLMISAGYGAEGMLGGYENKWGPNPDIKPEDYPPELLIDRSDIERYRQYYLSFDVDLSQIKTNSQALDMVLYVLNLFKFPAPALEINGNNGVRFYWLYF